jgi:hypothetical protein
VNSQFEGYIVHQVPANGDCFFAAIAHQLSLVKPEIYKDLSPAACRKQLVDYLKQHPDIVQGTSTAGKVCPS